MVEFDSIDEILEFAIAREEDSNQFYLALAAGTANLQMRAVFESLAQEELEHKAKLELEIIKRGKVVVPYGKLAEFNESDEIDIAESLEDMNYKDMLILAIQKEEASFRFYVDLVARVSDEASRDMLLTLAEEEVKHKFRFEIEYDNVLKGS